MKWILNDFTKSAFNKLLKPFENSMDDIIKITRAFSLAAKVHIGQFTKGNKIEPYINHPLRVALILTEEMKTHDVDLGCVALLHDTIEKSRSITINDQLRKEVGEHVYTIVYAVTRPKMENEQKEKIQEEYFQNIAKSSKSIRYVKVKRSDWIT